MTPPPGDAGATEKQQERVAEKFGAAATEWRDSYVQPRRALDYVLLDRKRFAVDFVRRYVPHGGTVLDAGCGAGLAALDLVRGGYRVHGVDVARDMIELAQTLFREQEVPPDRYAFTCAGLEEAGLADRAFDGIIALGFLQYQIDELAVLHAFHRLLAPEGVLVVTGPTRARFTNYFGLPLRARELLETMRVLKPRSLPGRVGRHKYSVGRFRTLLDRSGFAVLGHVGHGFAEFDYVSSVIGPRGDVALHRLLTAAARVLPLSRWGNDLVFLARKRP